MAEVDIDVIDEVDAELQVLVDPFVAKVAQLSEQIAAAEKSIRTMKAKRQRYLGVIRSINPEKAPSLYGKRNTSTNGRRRERSTVGISDERLELMTQWLQDHKEEINAGGGIHASGLVADPTFDIIPHQSGVSKALKWQHEKGILRLDHRGTGGAKYFKVV